MLTLITLVSCLPLLLALRSDWVSKPLTSDDDSPSSSYSFGFEIQHPEYAQIFVSIETADPEQQDLIFTNFATLTARYAALTQDLAAAVALAYHELTLPRGAHQRQVSSAFIFVATQKNLLTFSLNDLAAFVTTSASDDWTPLSRDVRPDDGIGLTSIHERARPEITAVSDVFADRGSDTQQDEYAFPKIQEFPTPGKGGIRVVIGPRSLSETLHSVDYATDLEETADKVVEDFVRERKWSRAFNVDYDDDVSAANVMIIDLTF